MAKGPRRGEKFEASAWGKIKIHPRNSEFGYRPIGRVEESGKKRWSFLCFRTNQLPTPPSSNSFSTFLPHSLFLSDTNLQVERFKMFSLVLPGRLPLSTPQQVDETHCIFPLEDASSIQHVVVFMTGVQPFPPGYSATVHLLWPSTIPSDPSVSASPSGDWKLLGCLRNTKPSAIFKVRSPTTPTPAGGAGLTATLGISIEPDQLVDEQMAKLQTPLSTSTGGVAAMSETTAVDFARKIAKNLFSYLSSYAPDSERQTMPLLQKWLQNLERKLLSQGPSFLDKPTD